MLSHTFPLHQSTCLLCCGSVLHIPMLLAESDLMSQCLEMQLHTISWLLLLVIELYFHIHNHIHSHIHYHISTFATTFVNKGLPGQATLFSSRPCPEILTKIPKEIFTTVGHLLQPLSVTLTNFIAHYFLVLTHLSVCLHSLGVPHLILQYKYTGTEGFSKFHCNVS